MSKESIESGMVPGWEAPKPDPEKEIPKRDIPVPASELEEAIEEEVKKPEDQIAEDIRRDSGN